MATFEINELQEIPYAFGSTIQSLPNPEGITTQTAITTSASSQQSAAFASTTKFIIIESIGGAVKIAVGADPTATSASFYIAGDRAYIFQVSAGHKIAVIDA